MPSEMSVVCVDWIARLGLLMRSLSEGAASRLSQVSFAASNLYERWIQADPISRLTSA